MRLSAIILPILITFCFLSSCYDIHRHPQGVFQQDTFYNYNGQKVKGNWTEGKRNGFFKTVNSDRTLLNQGNYSMGVQTGEWYYFHPNGKLHSKGVFENGVRTGQWENFYQNGKIKELRSYTNGQNYLLYSWSSDGAEMVVDGTGPYEFYFKDILRESGQYTSGLPSGNWKVYDENGTLIRAFVAGE